AASGSGDITCQHIVSCSPDINEFMGDEPGTEEACENMQSSISCMREALIDCREGQYLPQGTINYMEAEMDAYGGMFARRCS
ncbi:hypothetical protein BaRGS_00027677, partial [Batillaria attramentaria]